MSRQEVIPDINCPRAHLPIKICYLAMGGRVARHLGMNGQRRVCERFSLKRMVETYQELYRAVLIMK